MFTVLVNVSTDMQMVELAVSALYVLNPVVCEGCKPELTNVLSSFID